jgi:peptidoglycan/xylan/chitin deacetylase (PgdA/CDA1 family)
MFHYVRPKFTSQGIAGVSVEEFDALLTRLAKVAEFIHPAELFGDGIIGADGPHWRPKLLLSFDDGLKDHYQFVAPILERHHVSGLFFVTSQQYQLNTALPIHRWHAIREAVPDLFENSMYTSAISLVSSRHRDVSSAVRWDDGALAQFKYEFNYVMSDREKLSVVEILEDRLSIRPPKVDEVYMSRAELRDLVARGHWVCSHSHAHDCLSQLTSPSLRHDIATSLDFIESIGGDKRVFAYPFGKPESFNFSVQESLVALGVSIAFSSVPPQLGQAINTLAVPRLDPRDLTGQLNCWEAN